jgi:hypothetical protein
MNAVEAKHVLMTEGAEKAHADVTPKSLDDMADALITRVGKFFGECVAHPDFAGLSVDEERNEDGQLISLRMVPCDNVGGNMSRRAKR